MCNSFEQYPSTHSEILLSMQVLKVRTHFTTIDNNVKHSNVEFSYTCCPGIIVYNVLFSPILIYVMYLHGTYVQQKAYIKIETKLRDLLSSS